MPEKRLHAALKRRISNDESAIWSLFFQIERRRLLRDPLYTLFDHWSPHTVATALPSTRIDPGSTIPQMISTSTLRISPGQSYKSLSYRRRTAKKC